MPASGAAATTALPTALRVAVMRLARRLRQEGQGEGLTPSQLAALATVDKVGPLTLGELAAAERVQPPSMTRIVGALETAGLLARSTDPADGRVSMVATTRAGRTAIGAVRRQRDAWLESQLRALPAEDAAALARAVDVLELLAAA